MKIIDGSVVAELDPRLKEELVKGELATTAMALAEQKQIARDTVARPFHHVDGLGECTMRVHPDIYWRMVLLYGPHCWHDPEFRQSVYKKNEDVRVKSRSRKTALRVDGLKGNAGGVACARSAGGIQMAYR